jgi:hypothetical protein
MIDPTTPRTRMTRTNGFAVGAGGDGSPPPILANTAGHDYPVCSVWTGVLRGARVLGRPDVSEEDGSAWAGVQSRRRRPIASTRTKPGLFPACGVSI